MTLQPLRFAHAGNLRLDAPLRGVGTLPAAARRIAEDAPAIAWRRLVDACLERDVQFLLLTPRTISRNLLLRDRCELLDGFSRLDDEGVAVYWVLADDDAAPETWQGALPDNVTLLPQPGADASVIRDGRVVASIQFQPQPESEVDAVLAATPAERPLKMLVTREAGTLERLPAGDGTGLSAVPLADDAALDYVAGWGAARARAQTVDGALWLDPGTPLGRSVDEPGGGGLSIIEWTPNRFTEVLRAPTAPVRWERSRIVVTPETSRDELIERLQYALLELEPAVGEQLWIVDWHIVGAGPTFEQLQDAAVRSAVEEAVESALGDRSRLVRVHRWEFRPPPAGGLSAVSQRLQEWLDEHGEGAWPSLCFELGTTLRHAQVADAGDHVAQLSRAAADDEADRLLRDWLASPPPAGESA